MPALPMARSLKLPLNLLPATVVLPRTAAVVGAGVVGVLAALTHDVGQQARGTELTLVAHADRRLVDRPRAVLDAGAGRQVRTASVGDAARETRAGAGAVDRAVQAGCWRCRCRCRSRCSARTGCRSRTRRSAATDRPSWHCRIRCRPVPGTRMRARRRLRMFCRSPPFRLPVGVNWKVVTPLSKMLIRPSAWPTRTMPQFSPAT